MYGLFHFRSIQQRVWGKKRPAVGFAVRITTVPTFISLRNDCRRYAVAAYRPPTPGNDYLDRVQQKQNKKPAPARAGHVDPIDDPARLMTTASRSSLVVHTLCDGTPAGQLLCQFQCALVSPIGSRSSPISKTPASATDSVVLGDMGCWHSMADDLPSVNPPSCSGLCSVRFRDAQPGKTRPSDQTLWRVSARWVWSRTAPNRRRWGCFRHPTVSNATNHCLFRSSSASCSTIALSLQKTQYHSQARVVTDEGRLISLLQPHGLASPI